MKKISVLFIIALVSLSFAKAGIVAVPVVSNPVTNEVNTNLKNGGKMDPQTFLSLTPKKVEEMSGRKMTFKERIGLKLAQKKMKNHLKKGDGGSVPKGVYIVLAIFGLAWIAMGIMDNWSGNNWWLNLILVLLFWLPGFIHALIVMSQYY
jgi:uncharacterized membrane protein YqaE (UPF0057 family)